MWLKTLQPLQNVGFPIKHDAGDDGGVFKLLNGELNIIAFFISSSPAPYCSIYIL